MNVLIACERSQQVCKEFRALGHNAYSCDIEERWRSSGDKMMEDKRKEEIK